MKKKILILGQGITAHQIIKEVGKNYDVYVCGKKNRGDIEFKNVKHFRIDYSEKSKLLKILKKNKFDFIVPDGNDTSYLMCSFLSEKFNFPGYEDYKTTKILNSKIKLNHKLSKKKFVPKIIKKRNLHLLKKNFFPIIFRPDKSESGIGVKKFETLNQFTNFKKKNKQKGILNEYIDGEHFSCSVFFNKDKFKFFFVREKCVAFKVRYSSSPFNLEKDVQKKAVNIAKYIIATFKLKNGLLHIQFIKKKNKVFFIELSRRAPGDFFGCLINKSYNFNYYKNYLNTFLRKKIMINKEKKRKFFRETIYSRSRLFKIRNKFKNFTFYRSYSKKFKDTKIGVAIYQ